MIIGYSVFGTDNGSDMIKTGVDHSFSVCPTCRNILDFEYYNPMFRLKKKTYDLSSTYDNKHIVSLRFKEFCFRQNYQGLDFKEFEWEPNFYYFLIRNIVEFDSERRKTRFINFCATCSQYNEVIGNSPAYLKGVITELEDGIYRTNLLFGTGRAKQPLMVVGRKTYEKMKKEKLKGLHFEEINL